MVNARLQSPGFGEQVYIRLCQQPAPGEEDSLLLIVWVCTTCGCVELHADLSGEESECLDEGDEWG